MALQKEIAALQKTNKHLMAISSVAVGGDMIFAAEALRAGLPLTVLLPLARELFRQDFKDEDWKHAESLMAQAVEVRALKGTERPQVYVDCGQATVDACHYLFAVWDGKPPRGPGGTAEIVAYAQKLGREITLLREGPDGLYKVDPAQVT